MSMNKDPFYTVKSYFNAFLFFSQLFELILLLDVSYVNNKNYLNILYTFLQNDYHNHFVWSR